MRIDLYGVQYDLSFRHYRSAEEMWFEMLCESERTGRPLSQRRVLRTQAVTVARWAIPGEEPFARALGYCTQQDTFTKEGGRKAALTRLLQEELALSREERRIVWEQYRNRTETCAPSMGSRSSTQDMVAI